MKPAFNNIASILLSISIMSSGCSISPRYTSGVPTVKKPGKTSAVKMKRGNYRRKFEGVSSYYGKDFHGKLTANGEVFDMYGLTAAHKTLPLNTIVKVTNLSNNKSLILRINDRGPYVEGRILDCSYGAAKKLGFLQEGTASVEIEIIELGDDIYMKHLD